MSSFSSCNHCDDVNIVRPGVMVHKEECCYCFNTETTTTTPTIIICEEFMSTKQNFPTTGHNVCLTCFTGGCITHGHIFRHYEVTKHHVILNISQEASGPAQPLDLKDVKSLAELAKLTSSLNSTDNIKHNYSAYCITCDQSFPVSAEITPKLYQSLQSIIATDNGLKLEEFKLDQGAGGFDGFEEKPVDCHHTTTELDEHHEECGAVNMSMMEMDDEIPFILAKNGAKIWLYPDTHLPDLSNATKPQTAEERAELAESRCNSYKCQDCDIATNLWLCLSCGYLGCARKDYDGSGGNNHAVNHSEETGHNVVVKIATVTSGSGDLWCYACNNAVNDGKLVEHLKKFNIDGTKLLQSEKTMSDLQLQYNITAQFASVYNQTGLENPLMFGPGYTGLQNFGNSCYLASVLQLFFRVPYIYNRYYIQGLEHVKTCRNGRPAQCVLCILYKTCFGLFSGEYSALPPVSQINNYLTQSFNTIQNLQLNGTVDTQNGASNHKHKTLHSSTLQTSTSEMNDEVPFTPVTPVTPTHINKKQRTSDDTSDMIDEDGVSLFSGIAELVSPEKVTTTAAPHISLQDGVTIHAIRKLLSNKHPVFGNLQQQDAHEFFTHLRDFLASFEKSTCPAQYKLDTTTAPKIADPFAFKTQSHMKCTGCGHQQLKFAEQYDLGLELLPPQEVPETDEKYISLQECLSHYSTPSVLDGYKCPQCSAVTTTTSTTTLVTAPQFLIIQLRRFVIDKTTWSFTKNNLNVTGSEKIDLIQQNVINTTIPSPEAVGVSTGAISTAFVDQPSPEVLATAEMLQEMTMAPLCLILKCLKATKNDPDAAVEMVFGGDSTDHVTGCSCPGQAPPPVTATTTQNANPITTPAGKLDLTYFGQDKKPISVPNGFGKYNLVGFINHLGTTPHNGHYVSHINSSLNQAVVNHNERVVQFIPLNYTHPHAPAPNITEIEPKCLKQGISGDKWVCYNDTKVFMNPHPPMSDAYVYMFQRMD